MRGEFIGVWSETRREIWLPLIDHEGVAKDIRHGGTPANALRAVDMRDMVAMSIPLAGFTLYLSSALDADAVYRGG